jgi:hypothetical protein
MRYLTALFALCCFASHAQSSGTARPLTVFVTGDRASPPVLQALREAAESAFAPSGVKLSWLEGPPPETGVEGDLVVLRLKGGCRNSVPVPADPLTMEPRTLAVTHIADHKVQPFADVFCDAVRRFIQPGLKTAPVGQRDQLLGRALGRVAAHELYHILLHTTAHARSGISRAQQTELELLDPRAAFTPDDDQRLADSVSSDSSSPDSSSPDAAGR